MSKENEHANGEEVMPTEPAMSARDTLREPMPSVSATPALGPEQRAGGGDAPEPDEIEAATRRARDAHYMFCQGCIDGHPCQHAEDVDALAAIARRMRLERDGAEYDAGLERANVQAAERERDEARRLHDKCDARDIELGLCVPPWRQKP